jgi:acyl carrier protein
MTSSQEPIRTIVTRLVEKQLNFGGRVLNPDDNLWNLGLNSLSCMGLMLEIEDAFGVELPEERLHHATFTCVDSIVATVESAQEGSAATDGTSSRV